MNQTTVAEDAAARAYRMFDEWLERQSEDVQELSLLEQIAVYAKEDQHGR